MYYGTRNPGVKAADLAARFDRTGCIVLRSVREDVGMSMTSMNVSLPEPLRLFVEEQAHKGGYGTASDYLRELILEAQRRAEREEIEAKLLAGLQSPTSEMTGADWSALRGRILERSPELRGDG
jgi:antitoxin ParD1/3/4